MGFVPIGDGATEAPGLRQNIFQRNTIVLIIWSFYKRATWVWMAWTVCAAFSKWWRGGGWWPPAVGAGVVALPRPVDGRAPRRRGSGTSAFFTDRPGSKSSCGLLDILLGPEMTWSRTKRMVQPPSMAVSVNIKIRQWEWHFDFCLTARR